MLVNDPVRAMQTPVMISLTSGKGGVGKTSLSVNIAYALSQKNRRVLLVDGDLGLANVDVLLRLDVQRTLRDVLENNEDPHSAVVYMEPNLAILPASSGVPQMLQLGKKEQAHLGTVLKKIAKGFDFVLVDTAAGIGNSVMWLNTFVDYNFIVMTPDPTSMTDAYALIKVMAREYHRYNFYIILNQVQTESEGQEVFNTLNSVTTRFLYLQPHYLGAIPQDIEVSKAVREQVPFIKRAPRCKAALALLNLAERITR